MYSCFCWFCLSFAVAWFPLCPVHRGFCLEEPLGTLLWSSTYVSVPVLCAFGSWNLVRMEHCEFALSHCSSHVRLVVSLQAINNILMCTLGQWFEHHFLLSILFTVQCYSLFCVPEKPSAI